MLSNPSISREEYLKKKRSKKLIRYGIILFALVFIVGVASYVAHRPSIRISKIELSGGILVTQSEVESSSLSFVQGSYFWLFPKNNVVWYPHEALAQYLKDKFRRIDTIDIHLKNFNTLAIDITERKPVAMWCDGVPTDQFNCFFMDQNSTIFAQAPTFSGDAYFKYYGLVLDDNPIGKEYIASSTEFSQISDFVTKTKELKLKPLYLLAKTDSEFSLVIAGGGEIYFDVKEPLSLAGQNLEALLRTPSLASSTGNLPIEYIDLRYGNKLFYKLK